MKKACTLVRKAWITITIDLPHKQSKVHVHCLPWSLWSPPWGPHFWARMHSYSPKTRFVFNILYSSHNIIQTMFCILVLFFQVVLLGNNIGMNNDSSNSAGSITPPKFPSKFSSSTWMYVKQTNNKLCSTTSGNRSTWLNNVPDIFWFFFIKLRNVSCKFLELDRSVMFPKSWFFNRFICN